MTVAEAVHPAEASKLIQARHYRPTKTKAATPTDQDPGPELYSTGLTADEGLWQRKGWAGRS